MRWIYGLEIPNWQLWKFYRLFFAQLNDNDKKKRYIIEIEDKEGKKEKKIVFFFSIFREKKTHVKQTEFACVWVKEIWKNRDRNIKIIIKCTKR